MSIGKQRHECPRCAFLWADRTHAYYEEMIEWIQHCDTLEADASRTFRDYERRILILEHALAAARNDAIAAAFKREAVEEASPF